MGALELKVVGYGVFLGGVMWDHQLVQVGGGYIFFSCLRFVGSFFGSLPGSFTCWGSCVRTCGQGVSWGHFVFSEVLRSHELLYHFCLPFVTPCGLCLMGLLCPI